MNIRVSQHALGWDTPYLPLTQNFCRQNYASQDEDASEERGSETAEDSARVPSIPNGHSCGRGLEGKCGEQTGAGKRGGGASAARHVKRARVLIPEGWWELLVASVG